MLLPVIPAAWLVFGALLMACTAVTKALLQPPLYAHRPIRMFGFEFARWWLVQRLVGLTNMLFAEQLRGTPFLAWWFRALVRAPSSLLCEPACRRPPSCLGLLPPKSSKWDYGSLTTWWVEIGFTLYY